MRVLLVEPLGHWAGHFSTHTKYLTRALVDAGVDVTLLTYDGLLGGLDGKVKHISFISKTGALATLIRYLPRLFPSKFIQSQIEAILSTIGTFFLALRQTRKEEYQAVHLLDAIASDYAFPWFAAAAKNSSLVFTLFLASRKITLVNWWARFKRALAERQIRFGFELLVSQLLERGPASALRGYLYQKASRKNNLAFVCYTRAVHDSYSGSPFYNRIIRMFRGIELPEAQPLSKREAREHLGLPQDRIILLHFGTNYLNKNFEVIFQALKGLKSDYNLIFAGKVNPASHANIPWHLAQKYGLKQNIIIVDRYLTDEEAKYYFYAADAIILSHRKNFRGASGVLSTAAQYNLPVIVGDVGEVGETVKNYQLGLTFKAENPQSLRKAILSFFNLSVEEERKLRKNLLYFAQSHSWQEAARRYIELYQSLKAKSALR